MGTSFVPRTAMAMEAVERLMGNSMPACLDPGGRLGGLLDSDNLADMFGRAAAAGPDVDVRPLVAIELDEYVNWTSCEGWDPDVVERGRHLVAAFRDADVSRHVDRLVMEDTPEAALARVAEIQGLDEEAAGARLDARRGFAPGTFVVMDSGTGEAFRTEAVYGVVFAVPPDAMERVEAEIPATAPAAP